MPSTLINSFLDSLGTFRAIGYRLLVKRQLRAPQPMLNILQIKPGTEEVFREFLKKSLQKSLKCDTPISLGPYETYEDRIFIYITHYASTAAFFEVTSQLLISGLAFLRAKATMNTSWTYCESQQSANLDEHDRIIMLGIVGDSSRVIQKLNQQGYQSLATIKKLKSVRGDALDSYLLFPDHMEVLKLIQNLIQDGEDIRTYRAQKIS